MTLDEAIKHAEEVADGHDRIKQIKAVTLEECKRAEEYRQLAEWLKDYKRLLNQELAIDYFKTIYELSQSYGVTYDFIKNRIEEILSVLRVKSGEE